MANVCLAVTAALACPAPSAPESEPSPTIRVRLEVPPLTLHEELTAAEIGKLKRARKAEGFTRLAQQTTVRKEVSWETAPGGGVRFWVTEVEVTVGYDAIEVYIARDYRKGSCEYEAVLAHEQEHVRRDREQLEGHAKKIDAALRAADLPTRERPLEVRSPEEGKEKVEAQIQSVLRPLAEELQRKRSAAIHKLDADTGHQVVEKSCGRR